MLHFKRKIVPSTFDFTIYTEKTGKIQNQSLQSTTSYNVAHTKSMADVHSVKNIHPTL